MIDSLIEKEDLSWAINAALLVLFFVGLTIVGTLLIRRKINPKSLKAHHDVAAVVFANIGVLYSVLLGFTVVNVQQRFDKLKETAELEASILADIYRDSRLFSNSEDLRQSIKSYGEYVLSQEWKSMSHGEADEDTTNALDNLWSTFYKTEPRNRKEISWYEQTIVNLNQLNKTRLTRLLGSRESLGGEMWTLLIGGCILMVAFVWLFGLENTFSHVLMASIVAASTAFLLFLIFSFDTAFQGSLSIPPEGLQKVMETFNERY